MSETLEFLPWPHRVLDGPWDVGTEQRWRVQTGDGRRMLVGQLAPDLARDESIRRRYVRDVERLQSLHAHALVPIEQLGPSPDPRAPTAAPPWRVRPDIDGQTLERWLMRAPIGVEECTQVFAALADGLASVHAAGAVLRDLRPSQVVRTEDGRVVLIDVGLSRVDVLSSHTASSLLMQGSAYAAPEQVHATAVDERADLFSLGVMMWHAFVGSLPFGDGPAFLRERVPLPSMTSVRGDVPPAIASVVEACLHDDPSLRPATAWDVAMILRGGTAQALVREPSTVCQHCDAPLRLGQRLCLSCGRVSVRFLPAAPGQPRYGVDLVNLDEDATTLKWLQGFIADVSQPPIVSPEFLVGARHMYAEEERRARIALPARLFGDLDKPSAQQLVERLRSQGLAVREAGPERVAEARRNAMMVIGGVAAIAAVLAVAQLWAAAGIVVAAGFVTGLISISRMQSLRAWVERTRPRFIVRSLPAALPASDPLVARLAALLTDAQGEPSPGDVRALVAELALLVQRVTDHRAHGVVDPQEFDLLTEPLVPLVGAIERLVLQLRDIDRQLSQLDEGALVRRLASSGVRKESADATQALLQSLDRLRILEDRRAHTFHRLLQARSLLARTVELGLSVHDDGQEHDRQLALALAALEVPET